jgi:hypothetical protein
MKLLKKSNNKIFNLVWPKTLPTKEQMQENDMTGLFIKVKREDLEQEEDIIYAPFAENFDYELINEQGDTPWTISKQ